MRNATSLHNIYLENKSFPDVLQCFTPDLIKRFILRLLEHHTCFQITLVMGGWDHFNHLFCTWDRIRIFSPHFNQYNLLGHTFPFPCSFSICQWLIQLQLSSCSVSPNRFFPCSLLTKPSSEKQPEFLRERQSIPQPHIVPSLFLSFSLYLSLPFSLAICHLATECALPLGSESSLAALLY